MNRLFNFVGIPWQDSAPTAGKSSPPIIPTFYQPNPAYSTESGTFHTSSIDVVESTNKFGDGSIKDLLHPEQASVINKDKKSPQVRAPPEFTISPLHVDPSIQVTPDVAQDRTEALLNSVDLSILTGKKKKKKKIAVSIIPPNAAYLTPWLSNLGMTEYESKEQRLHDEIVAFVDFASPTPQEFQARQLIASTIEMVVKKCFRDATVSLFGSVATNLYLPDADINLLIVADIPRQLGARNALQQVSSGLRFAQISENSLVISRAKTPVITLSTTPQLGSFSVNISMNADTGVKAGNIVQDYLDKTPALRPLVLVLKRMLSQCGLNSAASAGLSPYSLFCMIMSFLQVNPKERPIESIEHPMEHESLGTLLLDFLFYYTQTFEYKTSRICVTSPGGHLSISCLVNPENDIGKPTTKLERILFGFRDAYNRIQNYPFSMQHDNCLGSVVGFPQSMLDQREFISQLVTSGSLEAQIRRCIVYMAKINPVFYPQNYKPFRHYRLDKRADAEESTSAIRGYDSYRPDYENGNAEQTWDASRKRKDGPEYQANYFGPRTWIDGAGSSRSDGYGSERVRERSSSRDRGRREAMLIDRGCSVSRHHEDKIEKGDQLRSRSRGVDTNREKKRLRLS